MRMIFCTLGLLVFSLVIFLAWAGYPWSLNEKKIMGEVIHVEPDGMVNNEDRPSVIKVLTWNIGFLYGEGSEGPGYEPQDKKFYQDKLDQFVKHLEEWRPDVLCLQEVDFNSARSLGIDEASYIAQKANYPYVAEAVSWDAHYIPFPYWPFSRHFGRVKSGGAVLSKYPILKNEIHLLQKPLSRPWWYNIFYLHRYFQKVAVQFGDKKFHLMNLHLEAFDKKDRESQVRLLIQRVKEEKIDLVMGDFNMVPLSATKKSKFPNGDDYENDPTYELMMRSGLLEVIPDEIYAKEETLYFTFPASRPDRRLDYIFYQSRLKMMRAEVLPSALSDHLPLRASFQIDSPQFNPYSL